ncbi:hypothetical protein JG687_00017035 [Phytophthora cactorum]|uniref:Uncharacterized protein n=1 Tax=Phytophthora cactorum TaxID=29920 RepID=A0A329RZ98_9STRA|nr:hypothetical protein Pcac1_g17836 [Phytophthora cactorum]KAG2795196.1 hypothetical protein PC111_g22252 [Phytophthora cactorum]KAG2798715.1 hypothetical protein PC112_g21231 [Phytophthora cactorum]KAG2853599.1 hypothetical protein PC113_g14047 [Phytophthora cactorum]KAG2876657.1 hypothetical protein PC114_g24088 [Phytophthora cactorum]
MRTHMQQNNIERRKMEKDIEFVNAPETDKFQVACTSDFNTVVVLTSVGHCGLVRRFECDDVGGRSGDHNSQKDFCVDDE